MTEWRCSLGGMSVASEWRSFMKKHWRKGVVFAVAAVLFFVESIYVFLWFAGNAESSGLVPMSLGLWSMSHLVSFIVFAVLWEILLVGIPIVVAVVVGWQLWWRRVPEMERRFHFGGRKRSTGGGGGSLLFFIAFCVKVFIDGRWNTPIATFTLDYVVGSMVAILIWGLIILGIPAAIGLTWWISRE